MDKEVMETSHRKVFREEIRNAIREAIFSGELNPGDRIIEDVLGEGAWGVPGTCPGGHP